MLQMVGRDDGKQLSLSGMSRIFTEHSPRTNTKEQLQCKFRKSGLSTAHEAQESEDHSGHQIQVLMYIKQAIYL